ncbi:MAG: T9SS type A sorting domain-containing protein [Bacteroidota bacterium]
MKKLFLINLILTSLTLSAQIGSTSFNTKVDFATGGNDVIWNTTADFDNDGKSDIATTRSASSVGVYRNTSTNGFINSSSLSSIQSYTTASGTNYITSGDIDGDSKIDIITSNFTSNTISILRNTSSGPGSISFAAKSDTSTSLNPSYLTMADIDGDGKPEIIISNFGSNTFSVYKNNSTPGTISLGARSDFAVSISGSSPQMLSIGDMNGDSKLDVAVIYYNGYIGLFKNTSTLGSISFAASQVYLGSNLNAGIALADLDADNKLDVVISSYNTAQVHIYKNTSTLSTISVATPISLTCGNQPHGIVVLDIDSDNKPEIMVANRGSNSISIFKNQATSGIINLASFASKVDFTTNTTPICLSVVDIDGDLKKELITSNNGTSNISVLRNVILNNEPTLAASAINLTTISNGWSLNISFTKGNGARRIILARSGSPVNSNPIDSHSYTANSIFGSGSQIGTGNYVVYNDTGNTVSVSGLTVGTNYYFTVFESNGIGGFTNYLTSSITSGNKLIGLAYYSKISGNLNTLSTWGANTDGTGTSPLNFTDSNVAYYVVNNSSPSINANWSIGGTNSFIVFGDGTNTFNLSIPSSNTITADSIVVKNNITFSIQGTLAVNKSNWENGSTALYFGASGQGVAPGNYSALQIINGSKNMSNHVTVKNTLTMTTSINTNSYILSLGTDVVNTGTLSRTAGTIIGKFRRWFAASINSGASGLLPIGTSAYYRPVSIEYTSAPSVGGNLLAEFIPNNPGISGLPLFELPVFISTASTDGYWRITNTGITGGLLTSTVTASGFNGINDYTQLKLIARTGTNWTNPGTSQTNSGSNSAPILSRTGLSNNTWEFGVGGDLSTNPLPVKLINFAANNTGTSVQLNWETSAEINNSHFEIERKTNNGWKTIGEIKGNGTSTTVNKYLFIDNQLNFLDNQIIFYRLKQIDYNGSFEYSNILSISLNTEKTFITVYPVPLQNKLSVNINSEETVLSLSLIDINGKEVAYSNSNNIDLYSINNGIYFIKVISDKKTYLQKVVK